MLVDRYGPDGELWKTHPDVDPVPVATWQIWNEQNSPTFYQPEVDPAAYATLLEAAHEAITERDPQGRGDPRRHVRHPAQGQAAGAQGVDLPS